MPGTTFLAHNVTYKNNIGVLGTSTLSGIVDIGGATTAQSTLSVVDTTTLCGTVLIGGAATAESTFTVCGATVLVGDLDVYANVGICGNLDVAGTIDISGDVILYSDLTVCGATTLAVTTISGVFTIPTNAALGKVLTSDATGVATWESNAGLTASGATETETITVIKTIATLSGKSYIVEGNMNAQQSGATDDFTGGTFSALLKNYDGTTELVGEPFTVVYASSSGLFTICGTAGNNFEIVVGAPSSEHYTWHASYTVDELAILPP